MSETVSTHSRPKAAEAGEQKLAERTAVSTHSRPKAAEPLVGSDKQCIWAFQHTAARRRLTEILGVSERTLTVSTHSRPKAADCFGKPELQTALAVSTHSRPKAADAASLFELGNRDSFNTQPPEGG